MDTLSTKYQISSLLDFYGNFLTDKQYQLANLYYNEDLSLSEISNIQGISRQAVWDHLKKAESYLYSLESKLSLHHKFSSLQSGLDNISHICSDLQGLVSDPIKSQIDSIQSIVKTLKNL